ncbi:MAG: tail fiber domain-containing protein [Candidatus Babeliales bacterium]
MGKRAPSAPPPPDPQATARATQVGYYGPGGEQIQFGTQGSGGFQQREGADAYRVVESPYQQQFRQGAEGLTSALLQNISNQGFANLPNSIDFSQVGDIPTVDQFEPQAQQATQAAYQRQLNLLNPEFERTNRKAEQSLANKGLPIGSEAYNEELGRISRQQGFDREQAALAADEVGRQEAQRNLANAMALRQQRIQDQMTNIDIGSQNRQQILAELGGLTGLQFNQPMRTPTFNQGAANAINQGYQNQLAYSQSRRNPFDFGGLGSLAQGAAALYGASSGSFKTDKEEVDKAAILDAVTSMRVEKWRYNWSEKDDKHIGPYAEEFKEKTGLGDGKSINMLDAMGIMMAAIQALNEKVEKLVNGNA